MSHVCARASPSLLLSVARSCSLLLARALARSLALARTFLLSLARALSLGVQVQGVDIGGEAHNRGQIALMEGATSGYLSKAYTLNPKP